MNEETGEMEPCLDITCAEDVPEDIAGLHKCFEPNFDAIITRKEMTTMTIRVRTGTSQGQAWATRQWNPDSCTTKPTGTLVAKACKCVTKRSKN